MLINHKGHTINTKFNSVKNPEAAIDAINRIPIINQLLDVICSSTGMGFAAIAKVTEDSWIACSTKDSIEFGLEPGDELQIETTICSEVRKYDQPVFIDEVEKDAIYCNHPAPLKYGFQSYVSVPIYKTDGSFFGTLCAIDPKPAKVKNPATESLFKLFSELISFHLNAIEEMNVSALKLAEEKKNSELREQFIAILGHDLKNPIATTRMSADILLKISQDEIVQRQAGIIKSTTFRMNGLIENILDFARGRLGEGIKIDRKPCSDNLKRTLEQIVEEIDTMSPGHTIELELQLEQEVNCDENRIAQMFSNLLGNAVLHGSADHPIKILAKTENDTFELSVENSGETIPETAKKHLFQPFYRDDVKPGKQGLGLGLFITSEIAKAHGGEMQVDSTNFRTRFTFKMPLN